MTENKIINCEFKSLTSNAGGALFIKKSDIILFLSNSYFQKCVSTSSVASSVRSLYPSGGACFIDIQSINITNVITYQCKANGFGHSIYIALPYDQDANFDCISDSLSGQYVAPYSTNYVFDKGNFNNKNINITAPSLIGYTGMICYGCYPKRNDNKFYNLVFNELDSATAIGYHMNDGEISESEYIHIENSIITSSELGILSFFYYGSYFLNYCYFINCEGQLEKYIDFVGQITFTNSFIDTTKIEVVDLSMESPCLDSNHQQFPVCYISNDDIVISCIKIINNINRKSISVPFYFIFLVLRS